METTTNAERDRYTWNAYEVYHQNGECYVVCAVFTTQKQRWKQTEWNQKIKHSGSTKFKSIQNESKQEAQSSGKDFYYER